MRAIIQKRPLYIQLLFTGFAFLLMIVLSYVFVNRIVHDNLVRNTESVMDSVESQIQFDLMKPQTILSSFAQTVRAMILHSDDAGKLQDYTDTMSGYIRSSENGRSGMNGLYGYIEKLPGGPVFLNGRDIAPPDGYSPVDRPWYQAALAANGGMAETSPYHDLRVTDKVIFTYSCCIYDDAGGYLGVVCIDMEIRYLGEKVVNANFIKGSYGVLIDQDLTILDHLNPDFVGKKMYDPEVPLSIITNDLIKTEHISEIAFINWRGVYIVSFFRKLPNGWYLGLLAPKNVYYQAVYNMALILSLLGVALAAVLMIILIRVDAAKSKSDMESRHKSAFLANMSHEIRTPMNAIIGMVTIGRSASDSVRKDHCFAKIEGASNHLLGVINDILDMSKIEANKFELAPVEFDLEKMLQRIVNIINFRVDEKRQKFSVHIDRSIPRTIIGDDQRIAQVITNLLGNAVKFTSEQGSISLTVRLTEKANGLCTLQFSVSDTGIGISTEQQEKLFKSFEQAESSTTRKYGGTGLGLAISKNIVELMGGTIGVRSEPGKGSVFSFIIQVRCGTEEKYGLLSADIDLSNVRILTVDDDPDVLTYFLDVAQGFGVLCDTAISGEKALELVNQKGGYHIYFIDWKMPVMDGIQLSRTIKERMSENSIVIMISAAEWSSVAQEAREAGVDKFLSKPLFPSTIAEVINECLGVDKRQAEKAQVADIAGVFAGRRILLAEDVEINREIVQALLEPTKLAMDCAENGAEAVRMFAESPNGYDMIFMDVQMPEMDGYEATRRIRALNVPRAKTIPIIAMTANVFREDVERCLEAGMDGHVGKPLDFEEVLNRLRSYLG